MQTYTIFTDKNQEVLYIIPQGMPRISSYYLKHNVLYWHTVEAIDKETAKLYFDTIIKPTLTEVSTC